MPAITAGMVDALCLWSSRIYRKNIFAKFLLIPLLTVDPKKCFLQPTVVRYIERSTGDPNKPYPASHILRVPAGSPHFPARTSLDLVAPLLTPLRQLE
jgi:hypothetical protein